MKTKRVLDQRERLIRQAIAQLFELQMHTGASAEELSRLAQDCIETAHENASVHIESTKSPDAQDYGTVLKTWHRQSEYLSADGLPRGLTVNGRLGLRRLIEHYYPKAQFKSVLE